ncbi:kinesin-like protein KIN-7G isoform X2 [Oryza brachyantha]|uniref:kinesin-like protein KIN-7G isoform X2 n=1 Tax=Oryza brachyantha TaxID=4533 RepID=UPI0007767F8F|nr:kinesin-like protein KIN-7G isoform X2 [Oryza brachyantha]
MQRVPSPNGAPRAPPLGEGLFWLHARPRGSGGGGWPPMASRHQRAFPPRPCAGKEAAKESVAVAVRFRPLSPWEVRRGEQIAWYADGVTIVRSEQNSSIAYAYDRVFGPTTTTCHIYDVMAQYVVSGAMEGINGTIFAYGVTSSGKTHTMHGDQRSPGVIPLAVKDIFNIIQETPNREFLLRVSYLEIYNEVVNDLLNPAGQNLRIREDIQGTFVEGIKEEVVLSPVHVLSLIAAGEEHRHVGSTNSNLLSSRSHTIFTLTIESSSSGQSNEGEPVTFSQLNLIDLAGSESSRVETTGVRQKEGSYINKSLLTLGTVISKLTDEKATHIPFRDSKLTRLLKSSLSGQGRVSLICTVTPTSSNSEETHNTLKFAHRAKHIEIQATQNKITDARSLIKKYQNEIRRLKEELEQLRRSILTGSPSEYTMQKDMICCKQKLEDDVKLQSRLEQEEEEDAKVVFLERIERLTKLILVSTKACQTTESSQHRGPRRRHSFGEELAYLPYERRDIVLHNENNTLFVPPEEFGETFKSSPKEETKIQKGLLRLKLRKCDTGSTNLTSSGGENPSLIKSLTSPSTSPGIGVFNAPSEQRTLDYMLDENVPANLLCVGHGEFPSDIHPVCETPMVTTKSDHVDILREQFNILSGEVAVHQNVLKRLSEEAGKSATNEQIEMEMKVVNDEIKLNKQQIASLERRISHSISDSRGKHDNLELPMPYIEIPEQLNEKAFKLKASECQEFQVAIADLKGQPSHASEANVPLSERITFQQNTDIAHESGSQAHKRKPLPRDVADEFLGKTLQEEIEELKQRVSELNEAKAQLDSRNQKLLEESTHSKDLALATGVELKSLSVKVTKLMKQNERLTSELSPGRHSAQRRVTHGSRGARREGHIKRYEPAKKGDMDACSGREQRALEAVLMEKDQRQAELHAKIEESRQKEAFLEGELANMCAVLANLKKSARMDQEDFDAKYNGSWA